MQIVDAEAADIGARFDDVASADKRGGVLQLKLFFGRIECLRISEAVIAGHCELRQADDVQVRDAEVRGSETQQPLLHAPIPEWKGAITGFACLHNPAWVELGPAYRFALNHVLLPGSRETHRAQYSPPPSFGAEQPVHGNGQVPLPTDGVKAK